MRVLPAKLKPTVGFSHFLHIFLNLVLPGLVFVFVRIGFAQLAGLLIVLSKWRMFAVRPRYWPANIRANAVDIMVGLSLVLFMASTDVTNWQLFWAGLYAIWLVFIKPRADMFTVSLQAGIAQTLTLVALFLAWNDAPLWGLVISTWAICYLSARHFFTSFDEPYGSLYAHTWGYIAAGFAWVLGHLLLFYSFMAQPALLLTVLGFGLAALYYLDETDRLSLTAKRQFIFIMIAIVTVVLVFSDWDVKAI